MTITRALGDAGQSAAESVERAARNTFDEAQALAQRSAYAVRDRAERWRTNALDASTASVDYVRREPVRTLLVALAAGALTLAVITLLRRRGY